MRDELNGLIKERILIYDTVYTPFLFPVALFNPWAHPKDFLRDLHRHSLSEVYLFLYDKGFSLGIDLHPPTLDLNRWRYPMCPTVAAGKQISPLQIERYQMIRDACSDGDDMETGSILLQNFK